MLFSLWRSQLTAGKYVWMASSFAAAPVCPWHLGVLCSILYILNLCFMKNSFRMPTFLQKYAFHINDPTRDMQVKRAQRVCMVLIEKLSINGRRGPRTSIVKSKMSISLAETSQVPDGTNNMQGKRSRRKTAGKSCKKWKYLY